MMFRYFALLLPVAGILAVPTGEAGNRESRAWPFPDNSAQQGSNRKTVKDTQCGSMYPMDSSTDYKMQLTIVSISCTVDILGTDGCTPLVSCSEFKLSGSEYLEVSDGMGASQKYNGTKGPQNVSSGASIMRVNFVTPSISTSKMTCTISCAGNNTNTTTNMISNALSKPQTISCKCGVPGGQGLEETETRIVGGQNAPIEYWKWQTAIVFSGRPSPFCGGALINDRYVLTAAHCVVTTGLTALPGPVLPRLIEVVFNEYDTSTANETVTVKRSVTHITRHPFYNAQTQDYDVALLKFSPPLNLTSTQEPNLTPVCLPPRGTKDAFTSENGTVTGWGTLTEGGDQATILQQAAIPVISNEECNQKYSPRIKITPRMVCAAYPQGGIDSCQGDSGGPFMLGSTSTAKYFEIGVVSFGEGCARSDKPGVYARVTDLNDWIRQNSWAANWCEE